MVKKHTMELIDVQAEEELRSLMHAELKAEHGEQYFKMLYTMDESVLPFVTEVKGRPPAVSDILYVSWFESNFLNFDNFKTLRDREAFGFIPMLEALMVSKGREGRVEALKALVGEAMQKAHHKLSLKREG